MAKQSTNITVQANQIISDTKKGIFAPIYLLQGLEPYYPELVCQAIIDNCIDEYDKDFNETIFFGSGLKSEQVIAAARRYPMMTERQLVVVKEAQMISDIESLSAYIANPLDSTVLVLLLRAAVLDKRKSLYKEISKKGVIIDSPVIRDYEIGDWISNYFKSKSIDIDPKAAVLLGESTGTDLSTIVMEADKLIKSLPEGSKQIRIEDVEKNVGISRQYSVFELTKELSAHNGAKALKIASHIGNGARFAMPAAIAILHTHFMRILRYAYLSQKGYVSPEDKTKALSGVNPYFYREYDTAIKFYPVSKSMAIISLLSEYDYLGKGGDGGIINQGELLRELCAKILSL